MMLSLWILACATEAKSPTPAPSPASPPPAPPAPAGAEPVLLPPDPAKPAEGDPTAMPANGTTPGMPRVDTLLGKVDGIHFLGDWTSKGCDGRSYARNVRFETDNLYAVIDLVSPCPTGTTCAWSGMTTFGGQWVIENRELKTRELGGDAQPGGPHPTKFVATMDGKLVENGCVYEKGLTVPEGYDPARVTPKVVR